MVYSHFQIKSLLKVFESTQNHVFQENQNIAKKGHFVTPGAGTKSPKNIFFLFSTYFSGVFERVKNMNRGIPRHRRILKEPSVRAVIIP